LAIYSSGSVQWLSGIARNGKRSLDIALTMESADFVLCLCDGAAGRDHFTHSGDELVALGAQGDDLGELRFPLALRIGELGDHQKQGTSAGIFAVDGDQR
jgi:hypothetical protein